MSPREKCYSIVDDLLSSPCILFFRHLIFDVRLSSPLRPRLRLDVHKCAVVDYVDSNVTDNSLSASFVRISFALKLTFVFCACFYTRAVSLPARRASR